MIKDNLFKIRRRISSVCTKLGLDSNSISIVGVAKNRPADEIKEAIECGITKIGENNVQEALSKYDSLQLKAYSLKLKWHMVGHLQTNKVKEAVKIFDLIESVDSIRLAQEINKQAGRINKIQDILLEVKTSPEAAKFGLKADETIGVIKEITKLKNINIKGLMTIAPIVDNPEKARPYFRQLRELKDRINNLQLSQPQAGPPSAEAYSLGLLSMGMTDDFEIAIEEGSNMIRLGRAIFDPFDCAQGHPERAK